MLEGNDSHFEGRVEIWLGNVDFGDCVRDAAVLAPVTQLFDVFEIEHVETISGADSQHDSQVKEVLLLQLVDRLVVLILIQRAAIYSLELLF
jgi:hypothetical protein